MLSAQQRSKKWLAYVLNLSFDADLNCEAFTLLCHAVFKRLLETKHLPSSVKFTLRTTNTEPAECLIFCEFLSLKSFCARVA